MMNAAENKGVDTTVTNDSDTNTTSTTPTTDNNNTPSSNSTNNNDNNNLITNPINEGENVTWIFVSATSGIDNTPAMHIVEEKQTRNLYCIQVWIFL